MRRFVQSSFVALSLVAGASLLGGCDLAQNQLKVDRAANMEMQDFRDGLAPRMDDAHLDKPKADDKIPDLQSYVAQPSGKLKAMPLVSISVNQTVPLRDVLYELAEQANYDVELDPRITGSIIFTARDRPFDLVVQRIAEIAGLRYKFQNNVLRVELDTPYLKTYKIDYLAYVRKNTSSIRNDIAVVTGQGTNTGSGFEAQGSSEADFWGELATNLQQILGVPPTVASLTTLSTPQITAAATNPAPVAAAPVASVNGVSGARGTAVDASGAPIGAGSEAAAIAPTVQAPQAVLQVSSLPTDTGNDRNASGKTPDTQKNSFSVNKQAGMLTVFANEKQHEEIAAYLQELKRSVTAQVLIEAKVMEVSLSDEYSAGINWNDIGNTLRGIDITLPQQVLSSPDLTPVNSAVELRLGANDVNAVISAISRFGTVRALASPRLTVLNNQSAVLNVAQNLVYFKIDINVTRDEFGTETDVDSDIRNVPEGVLINVQPSINLDEQTVSMAIRPTITNVESFTPDPAVAFAAASLSGAGANITSNIPVVNVQEFDSVINVNSGQAIVMGGLMQDRTESNENAMPVMGELPVIGALFKAHGDRVQKTELVVFLKATILDGKGNVHSTDKELYKTFSGDRRPLDL
jgi:general secretion pathway protein D